MANGAFSGVIWGALVAVAGAGGLSLAYPDFKPGVAPAVVEEAVAEIAVDAEAATDAPAPEMQEDATPALETAETPVEAPSVEAEDEAQDADAEIFDPESIEDDAAEADVANAVETPRETEAAEPEATETEAEAEADPETAEAEDTTQAVENADAAERVTDEIIAALPKPTGTVGDLAPEVTTDRLPSLDTADDAPSEDAPSAVAPPPFERFSSKAVFDADKPKMAIVLIDMGDEAMNIDALTAFPYPLTYAVNASAANAGERMQVYRDKGFEVLALVDLPRGATPSDVEVAMSAYLSAVPEAVGILEGVDTGVQTSREMADQLTQIILDSGHGMLLQKSGLNTARKLAEREGIPAATVFRDFDGNGQSASVMRRFLDQAAFRAGQEGGVVMMGRLQAETISALLVWGLADRASRVALVPVSAVLQQEQPDEG